MQSSTQRRTNKHLTEKEKFMQKANTNFKVVKADLCNYNGDGPFIKLKHLPHLTNFLIDHENRPLYIEHAVRSLENINTQTGYSINVTVCACCAIRFGIKRCGGCPSDNCTRYCSRRCQLAHWQKHKAVCGGRLNEK